MECNKDEAVRAKQIAESKMQRGDFVEALKFAMKAKKLYPDVENTAQILTVCEVHIAARNKLSGSDMDWYGILQTERFADDATIKKQYRKLALQLHPDKNKFAGAEAAFKLIGDANRVLSDQAKRSSYDLICRGSMRTAAPKPPFHHSNGNATNSQNNFYSHSAGRNSQQQDEQKTSWTCCKHCSTRFQYYKSIVNATLRCPKCLKSFTADDLGYQGVPPVYTWTSFNNQKEAPKQGMPKAASYPVSMKKCATGVGGHCKGDNSKHGCWAKRGTKSNAGTSKPAASKAKDSHTSTNVGSKRVRQSAPDSRESCKDGNGNDMEDANAQQNGVDPSGLNARRSSRQKQHVSYMENPQDGDFESPSKKPRQNESVNTTEFEKRKVPASDGLSNNNNPASSAAGVGGQNRVLRNNVSSPPEKTFLWKESKIEQSHVQREEVPKSNLDLRKSKAGSCSLLNLNVPSAQEIIYCPDTDFGDFEKDKAEDCFAVNQFWAIYDPIDSMPRFYALVKKMVHPFKLLIAWLEPDPDDQGEIDWHNADLPIACGRFKLGDPQKTTDRAMFSHQMHCIKGSGKGSYLVYPQKGETWAIFRDWDIAWSSNPKKYLKYEFEYVEILSDFAENVGIEVSCLGKVEGFVSLFQKTEKNGINLFCVPPNERYRFSHRIPSYKMTGNEREGVPRGSFEFDPAALPINLSEVSDSGDVKMENGMLNPGANCSFKC